MGPPRARWLPVLVLLGWMAYQFARYGFAIGPLIGFGIALLVLLFGESAAQRVARPWRTYLAAALGSAFLGLLLSGIGFTRIALIFWLVLTALALSWAWYWERTEPLPSPD